MTADELMAELDSAMPDERPVVVAVQYVDSIETYNITEVERYEDAIVWDNGSSLGVVENEIEVIE